MQNINELIGIIKGIDFDGVINDMEVDRLQAWVDKNRNLSYKKDQALMIKLVDEILEDHIITDEEKEELYYYCEKYLKESDAINSRVYELNGIIEGIISDGIVNETEIIRLKKWFDDYGEDVKAYQFSTEINDLIEEILSDGIITEEEQDQMLELLQDKINTIQLQTKLNRMRNRVKQRKNIGLDLIDILDNKAAIKYIHEAAITQLRGMLRSYSGSYIQDPEIVFISLCLIGMMEYDGIYYDSVRETYKDLYWYYSEQKIEGRIRNILSRYRTVEENRESNSRIINVALSNSIVPAYFLPSFFEFIFDIYKLNFEYDLPEDMYEEFQFVYEGLRNSMLLDDDDLKVNVTRKSYKLIVPTKRLITNEKYLDSVIKLSIIIVKLIDKRYWNKEIKFFNPYLRKGFEEWEKTLLQSNEGTTGPRQPSELRSRWEPKYVLIQNKIYLSPPIHSIKKNYEYSDITIVVKNGEEILYEEDRPNIQAIKGVHKEVVGGYRVIPEMIKLDHPLGDLRYYLQAGDEIIYDSRDKLYRKFIVFNDEGLEIKNNTDYKGVATICANRNQLPFPEHASGSDYALGSGSVVYGDVFLINDELFSFSALTRPGVFGEKLTNQYLKKVDTDTLLPVFSEVKFLVFESTTNTEKYEIVINNRSYRLSDFHYTRTAKQASWKYVVDMPVDDAGLYTVAVYELYNGKRTRIALFSFGYDPMFELEQEKLDDYTYIIRICSGFLPDILEDEIDTTDFSEDWLTVECDEDQYVYYIPLQLNLYRIDNQNWKPMSERIWIGDIGPESKMELYGLDADKLNVYSDKGHLMEDIEIVDLKTHKMLPVGFLNSYKESNDYAMLAFLSGDRIKQVVFCYNKCVMNEDSTEIQFDPITGKLSITPYYYGKGNVIFEIVSDNGEVLFSKNELISGKRFAIKGLKSFTEYKLVFSEKPRGLLLKKKPRIIMRTTGRFYARKDLVGRYFCIRRLQYYQPVKDRLSRKDYYLNHYYVHFNEAISEDYFRGEVVVKAVQGRFKLSGVNPVDIEICSDVMNGTVELAMTNDGDGLLLDVKSHRILNTMEDDKAVDIYSYTIDVNGERRL